jgi:hypothetical protein
MKGRIDKLFKVIEPRKNRIVISDYLGNAVAPTEAPANPSQQPAHASKSPEPSDAASDGKSDSVGQSVGLERRGGPASG